MVLAEGDRRRTNRIVSLDYVFGRLGVCWNRRGPALKALLAAEDTAQSESITVLRSGDTTGEPSFS